MDGVERVFVYGTLMPGRSNAGVAERAGLVAVAHATVRGYRLYHLEPEGYPAVVRGTGEVHGVVLETTGSLQALDELEAVHAEPPLYRRVRCAPVGLGEAWIYLYARLERLDRAGAIGLPNGRWPAEAGALEDAYGS